MTFDWRTKEKFYVANYSSQLCTPHVDFTVIRGKFHGVLIEFENTERKDGEKKHQLRDVKAIEIAFDVQQRVVIRFGGR